MIKIATAHSFEVYDADLAARDILGQLDLDTLSQNCAGLLFCNLEFVESGALEAVCAALPFDVVGCTTQGTSVRGAMGHIMMTLTVLSSDDVTFATSVSEPLTQDPGARIGGAYADAASKMAGAPSMMFAFQPYLPSLRGDTVLRTLDSASGDVPVFGSIALDFTTEFRSPMTIMNGKAYADRLPLLLLSENAKPVFLVESLPEGRATIAQDAIVTDARDNLLISVNNAPAYGYMEELGLASDGAFNGTQLSLPVLLNHMDGEKPKACTFFDITPEGFVRCGGEIPVGATFSIGSLGHDDVVFSAGTLLRDALDASECEAGGLLLFSCFSRNIVLTDNSTEMKAIDEGMKGSRLPYSFMHSGGELCPMYDESGKAVNRYHNYSLIGCLL